MEQKPTIYFDEPGDANTEQCLNIAMSEVEKNGYMYIIVASKTGRTGGIFANGFKGIDANLMIISSADGGEPVKIHPMRRQMILNRGATLFNAPSLSFSLDQAFGQEYMESNPSFVVRQTLSTFGEGIRACCECVMAATDGGLVSEGMEVVAVAGTGSGADTVAIIRAASSKRFRELRVREILAWPRD